MCMGGLCSHPHTWASLAPLISGAIVLLAVAGAICRSRNGRVWWLGFSILGGAYLAWAYTSCGRLLNLPTVKLFNTFHGALQSYAKQEKWQFFGRSLADNWQVMHGLASLLVAVVGGAIALAVFGHRRVKETVNEFTPELRRTRRLASVCLSLVPILAVLRILAANQAVARDPKVALIVLLTAVVLMAGTLGALSARGGAQACCLGIALFGVSYLAAAFAGMCNWAPILPPFGPEHAAVTGLPTDHLVNVWRPSSPRSRAPRDRLLPAIERNHQRIIETLELPIDMQFRYETPIEDLLKYIQNATRASDGWELPIYVEPVTGLGEAEKTMTSPVQIELTGVPLKTTLHLVLRQLGLEYRVEDGLLRIKSETAGDRPPGMDSFLVLGHCLLAMLCAAVGGVVAPLVRACVLGGTVTSDQTTAE